MKTLCAALRSDGLKWSHWSMEVKPVPDLSEHRLAAGSGGLLTFFPPHPQSLFAGALEKATEGLALRLLKCCTTEYS